MDIKNKKINFMGDSITAGVGTSSKEAMFVNLIGADGAVVRNYGISGTRLAKQQDKNDGYDKSFCERFDSMDKDADLVIVFGGTNDYGHGDAPFGDENDTEYTTFCGACNWFMNEFENTYKNAKLLFLTPIHRENENAPSTANSLPLSAYVNAIKSIAKKHDVSVLDLYDKCEIYPDDPKSKEKYCPDGLHPNDAGNALIKNLIVDYIKNNF